MQASAVHPGRICTLPQRHMRHDEMVANGWNDRDGNVVDPTFTTPGQGAARQVWAATSPRLSTVGGWYPEDRDVAEPAGADPDLAGVRDYAADTDAAAGLWELSSFLAR